MIIYLLYIVLHWELIPKSQTMPFAFTIRKQSNPVGEKQDVGNEQQ